MAKQSRPKKKKIAEMTVEEMVEKYGYNLQLMERIQPVGGISFAKDERYIVTGEGYEAAIHIYEYPKTLSPQWLLSIVSIKNTVTLIDVATANTDDVKTNINRSIREQNSRYATAKNVTEQMDAQNRYQELRTLYDEVVNLGEVVKEVVIRVFIAAQTYADADKIAKGVIKTLASHNFKATIYLNESKAEWRSMYQTYAEQQKTEYKRYGQPLQSEALAAGNPLHFSSLSDPNGTYLGYTTSSSGSVLFDGYRITSHRLSYDGMVFGGMGAGKSTLLKKLLLDRAVRGDYVRGFDVTGEFTPIIHELGGVVVSFNGTEGIINDLQVLRTSEKEAVSYAQHITKLATIYKIHAPSCDAYELAEYQQLCSALYEKWGLLSDDLSVKPITGLPNESYPTYSDLLAFVREKLQELYDNKDTGVKRERLVLTMKRLSNIEVVLAEMIRTYGYMLDGHTSIENILNQQIVYFNIADLANMSDRIFDSRIYSALLMFWDNGVQIGAHMKDLYDHQKIAWEDITRYMIIVDEAHHLIRTDKEMIVDQLIEDEREGRKFFIGMIFATQSVRDCIPEGSEQQAINKIKTLFELTQYKFVLRQDSNARDLLGTVFRSDLTPYQLDRIPRFGKGQCILIISGDQNIEFNIEISEDEKQLFAGGA